ncbi:hypothetical protein Tco_0292281 [Tanacetum coccineum]
MEDTLSKFMSESAKRHEENSNLIKEIRASTDAAIRNQGTSIKTLEIQIGQMSKVLQERGFGSLPSSTETNPRDQVKSISTTIEADSHSIRRIGSSQYAEKDPGNFTLPCFINDVCFDNALVDLGASVSVMPLLSYLNLGLGELAHTRLIVKLADRTVKYPKGIAENVLVEIGKFTFPVDFIILDMPEDIKVPLILKRPFLSTACAKIDVYKRKITLRVGEENIIFKSIKPTSSLIKRVYMLSLRERMELDLEARLMGETLVLNRSLDPFLEDYIELNDLNEPFELRRNQGDDLMPTIEEGEVIEEFRTRDEDLDIGIDDYPSYCDDDKKIHIDADNRPPMLEKDMYDSWKSRIKLYMMNRQHGRMILESVENGPLIWPSIKENRVTRPKKYSELSATEAIQADCDIKATNIILEGLPPEVYALVSNHKFAKELWARIQLLIQGTSLTK